jgi:hypothetical protein
VIAGFETPAGLIVQAPARQLLAPDQRGWRIAKVTLRLLAGHDPDTALQRRLRRRMGGESEETDNQNESFHGVLLVHRLT